MSEKLLTAQKERIEKAALKLKQEKAKMQKIQARTKYEETKKARALDTRKKILVGACFLAKAERNEGDRIRIMHDLKSFLTRAEDRALFDLPPLESRLDATQPQESEKTANTYWPNSSKSS